MRKRFFGFLAVLFIPFAAHGREGTPVYYDNAYPAQYQRAPSAYMNQNVYVGTMPQRQIIGQRSYTYQTPRSNNPIANGTMTANGVSLPRSDDLVITAEFRRKYADFRFETGVQSILEWDGMVVNEIALHIEKDFVLRDYDVFAYAEYATGTVGGGGMSMDYDLRPYNNKEPDNGIFTISMGGQSGKIQDFKIGVGARHIWDVEGWKFSPILGYQVFKHDLKMNNHVYPNPAVYIPLMDQYGDYIFGDLNGNYYSVGQNQTDMAAANGWYQVCMSPEDLALAAVDPGTKQPIVGPDGELMTVGYNPLYEYLPWGVGPGECIVVGGDGMIMINGVTHIYNTTWSGIFLGLEIEKQMTYTDALRFYAQVSMPHYRAEGTWPNRDDWQQNPSFIDEGDNGAFQYQMELEYTYKASERVQVSLKASTEYFSIGNIGGELYVAGRSYLALDEEGKPIVETDMSSGFQVPILITEGPYTEKITDSLKSAVWQSFGLHLGVKYAF